MLGNSSVTCASEKQNDLKVLLKTASTFFVTPEENQVQSLTEDIRVALLTPSAVRNRSFFQMIGFLSSKPSEANIRVAHILHLYANRQRDLCLRSIIS